MLRRAFLASALGAAFAARAEGARRLYIQPLGRRLAEEDTRFVTDALRAFFSFDLVELPPVPLPRRAFYAPRKRWRAEVLLDFLRETMPPDGDRVLDVPTTPDAPGLPRREADHVGLLVQ